MASQKRTARSLAGRRPLRVIHSAKPAPPVPTFWLDLANEILRDGDKPLELTPKAFAVLRYLREHPQRLVTKQELFDSVWAGTYVTDGVLKNCISEIRQALQDSATKPRHIETVHRRGYRFLAPLTTTLPLQTSSQLSVVSSPQPPTQTPNPEPRTVQPPVLSPHPRTGERRQLTVMCCDLVDATALSTRLDPEDYRELIRIYTKTCSDVVARYEGYVAQYLGDGILAYFGYPTAHDDEARRAARAGLDIVEAIAKWVPSPFLGKGRGEGHAAGQSHPPHPNLPPQGEKGFQQLHVRVGIHTGPVVIDDIGVGGRAERVALGETLNVAARLQTTADTDTVVISASTQRLVAGYFVLHSLGAKSLDGLPTPTPAYRVVEESPTQSRIDIALTTGLTPLVGRESELSLLQDRWAQAKGGQGQALLVSGEPGIGKSRLALTLKEHLRQEESTYLEFRCSPYYQATALYPIIEHLQRVLTYRREDTAKAKLEKLQSLFAAYRFPQADTLPLLAVLLSLPHPDGVPPLALSPQRQKQKLLETLIAWLTEEAEHAVTYMLWEDLQWADPSTLEVLTLYLDQVPMTRTLAVFTARPEFEPPWGSRSYMSHLTLHALPRVQSEAMVKTLVGDRTVSLALIGRIAERSDGIPLFVEELTKSVVEAQGGQGTGNRRQGGKVVGAQPAAPSVSIGIPTTLQDALLARLDRLGEARATAQLGAVLGREFTYEILQAVGVFDADTLQGTLPKLVEAELVYQRGLGEKATYTFKHALIQDAAYQSLLRRTRQQYHRQTAQTLEERFPETKETQPELLAHHCTAAGLTEQAITYWQAAGKRAIMRSANLEAIRHLETGLELLKTLPETPERVQRELGLQMTLGLPLMTVKGYAAPEVERAFTRARTLCQRIGAVPQLAPVLHGLCAFHAVRGELRLHQELSEQNLRILRDSQDSVLQGQAYHSLGVNFLYRGEFPAARAQWDLSTNLYKPEQHQAHILQYGQDSGIASHAYNSWTLWLLGYPDQARQRSREGLALAQNTVHFQSAAYPLTCTAVLHGWLHEWPALQTQAERILHLATEQGLALWIALGTVGLGWSLVVQGRHDAGLARLRQGLAAYQATGAQLIRSWQLCVQAQAYLQTGQIENGLHTIAEALAHIERTDERWYEAEVWRTKGELLLTPEGKRQKAKGAGDWGLGAGEEESQKSKVKVQKAKVTPNPQHLAPNTQAEWEVEECFFKALDVARRQRAKSWELRASTSLARLWQHQGKRAKAHKMLSEIYHWFTEGFDTHDLQEAKALLGELRDRAIESSSH